MRAFSRLAVLSAAILGISTTAVAAPFTITWDGIIANSGPGYNDGEALSFVFVLDNGGTDAISQTWDTDDIVSVTVELNNGAINGISQHDSMVWPES